MSVVEPINGFAAPVAGLMELGRPANFLTGDDWGDYRALGLSEADTPQLIRMATDRHLNEADPNSDEVWAPVHAWRALAQFGATEAAGPLMDLAGEYPDDEGVADELPHVFAALGPETLPILSTYLGDSAQHPLARVCAANCVGHIGRKHEAARGQCKQILRDALANHRRQPRELNGFLVNRLVRLQAREHLAVIRSAFVNGSVDTFVIGDLEDAEIELGVRSRRTTRRGPNGIAEMLPKTALAPKPSVRHQRKIGRNEPCPCGSGKKYKKCCGET